MDRSDIFISYRRADVEFTKKLHNALKETGREIWVDWEDIPPGVEGFSDEIQRGIEGADAFICVLSPSYLESEYCLMELREALKLKKRVVPVVLKKFDPLPPPEGIGHINWVYFTTHAGQKNTFDQAMPKVIEALEADYEYTREHTRLFLRALDWDKGQRGRSYLLKEAEIEKAEHWQVAAVGKNPLPTELHGEYILTSRTYQRQQQRRIMAVIGILLGFAVIAAIFAGFQWSAARRSELTAVAAKDDALAQKAYAEIQRETAVSAKQEAEIAQKEAERQEKIAREEEQNALISSLAAQSQLIQSRQLGILTALEAYNASLEKGVSPAVQTSLRSALIEFSGIPVHTYQSDADFVAFSPDDHWLVSTTSNGQLQMSDLSQGLDAKAVTLVEQGAISNVIISPDSLWLAGIYDDSALGSQSIRLWSLNDIQANPETLELPETDVSVLTLTFGSSKSRKYWLAAGLADGSIYTWNVPELPGVEPIRFYQERSETSVAEMAFSPDGRWLAAVFQTKESITPNTPSPFILIWNMQNPVGDPLQIDLIQAPIHKLIFSRTGKWLAGASEDSSLKVWNMDVVSQENPSPSSFKLALIDDIAFSADDRWLAVAGGPQVGVMDLRRQSNFINLPGYRDYVLTVGFTPDSQWLATGDWDGQVRLWNMGDVSGDSLTESQAQLFTGFDVIIHSLEFNSDGTMLAAAGDRQVRVWGLPVPLSEPLRMSSLENSVLTDWVLMKPNEKSLLAVKLQDDDPTVEIATTHNDPIRYEYSSDERYLVVSSRRQIQVWDLNDPGSLLFGIETPNGKYIPPIFSEDNRWLAYADYNQIFILDLQNPTSPVTISGNRKVFSIASLYFIGQWLVSQSSGEILAWDLAAPQTPIRLSRSTTGASVTFFENEKSLVAVQQSRTISVWDAADFAEAPIVANDDFLDNIFKDRWLITSSKDGESRLWDLTDPASPKLTFSSPIPSNLQNWIVYSLADGTVQALDLTDAALRPVSLGIFQFSDVLFSADDHWLVFSTSSEQGPLLRLYDLTNDLTQREVPDFMPLRFSPDEHWLVMQDQAERIVLYDLEARQSLSETYPPSDSDRVYFSPDSHWLFAVQTENSFTNALLIDMKDPGKSYLLAGHIDELEGGFFTPDGRWLMTYSWDETVRVWDLNDLEKDPVILRHSAFVSQPGLSRNGKFLATWTEDNFTYIWRMDFEAVHDLACRLVGRNLTEAEWTKYVGSSGYRKTCEQWP